MIIDAGLPGYYLHMSSLIDSPLPVIHVIRSGPAPVRAARCGDINVGCQTERAFIGFCV